MFEDIRQRRAEERDKREKFKDIILHEGRVKKGGINTYPSCPRPAYPPIGQPPPEPPKVERVIIQP